jgi:hypothetical protein
MVARRLFSILAATLAVLVAGCATRATSIDTRWVSPGLATKAKVQKVLVVAALRDSSQRRLLEDRVAETLGAAGVKGVQSYTLLPDGGSLSEAQLREAVAKAAASHVLISSVTGTTTNVTITQPVLMGPGWGPGWGTGWASMGPGWGGMTTYHSMAWSRSITPDVRTTNNLHGDTRLFDAASSEVVWSAATTTVTGWDSVPSMIDQFSRLIVDALRKDGVVQG